MNYSRKKTRNNEPLQINLSGHEIKSGTKFRKLQEASRKEKYFLCHRQHFYITESLLICVTMRFLANKMRLNICSLIVSMNIHIVLVDPLSVPPLFYKLYYMLSFVFRWFYIAFSFSLQYFFPAENWYSSGKWMNVLNCNFPSLTSAPTLIKISACKHSIFFSSLLFITCTFCL